MMRHMEPRADTLGCTNGWQDPSPSLSGGAGNWTTTIELDGGCYGACAVTFWTSNNYVNWSYVGNLTGLPPAFAIGAGLQNVGAGSFPTAKKQHGLVFPWAVPRGTAHGKRGPGVEIPHTVRTS